MKDGTLTIDGCVVAGDAYAPIRFIEDFRGKRIQQAGPSEPVRISGFNKLPTAGTLFSIVKSKKTAEILVGKNASELENAPKRSASTEGVAELPLIIKTDVAGSLDAIVHELKKITHERAELRIVSSGIGNVSESDVKTAQASGGIIISFNTGTDAIARDLAERESIAIKSFTIIYELSDAIKKLLSERVPSIEIEKELGRAKVLKTFSSGAKKQVLGARYVSGILTVGDRMKIFRQDAEIARGSIKNLQQARADVKEIKTEGDFGIEIECRENSAYGDELVAFVVTKS